MKKKILMTLFPPKILISGSIRKTTNVNHNASRIALNQDGATYGPRRPNF